jgi:hypothetical protein
VNGDKVASERNIDELTHSNATAKAIVRSGKGDSLPEGHLKSCQEKKDARTLNGPPVFSRVAYLPPYELSKDADMSPYEREDMKELSQDLLETTPSEALFPGGSERNKIFILVLGSLMSP